MMTGVRRLISVIASVVLLPSVLGCEQETTSRDRENVPSGGDTDAGEKDAGLTEAGVDPNGGRDSDPASCFATCSNTAFTCQAKSGTATVVTQAELSPAEDGTGCVGSLKDGAGTVALKLDCPQVKVCIGGTPGTTPTDCVAATFSAMTYGYTPNGGVLTVCTRD